MSKALCISAAIALALSGAAFAKGGSKSSARSAAAADAQIVAADCEILTVKSAKAACLRAARPSDATGREMGIGQTAGGGGMGEGRGPSEVGSTPTGQDKAVSN